MVADLKYSCACDGGFRDEYFEIKMIEGTWCFLSRPQCPPDWW